MLVLEERKKTLTDRERQFAAATPGGKEYLRAGGVANAGDSACAAYQRFQ